MLRAVFAVFSLLIALAPVPARADDFPTPVSTPPPAKDADTAALLGGLVGFGAGHYYANDRWTTTSTFFAVTDTIALGLTVLVFQSQMGAGNNTSLGNGFIRTFGVAAWATLVLTGRYLEMNSAREAVEAVYPQPPKPDPLEPPAEESRLTPAVTRALAARGGITFSLPILQARF